MNETDNVSKKDGDHIAVEPQSTNQSVENTFSHILHELNMSEQGLKRTDLLLDA